MNRKAGTPIAILILTFGIIVLMLFAWFTFLTKQNQNIVQLQSPDILNSVYAKETEINFQLSQLMKESLNNLEEPLTKNSFINKLKEKFEEKKLVILFPELKEIKNQFTEQNLEIQEDNITLKLSVKIDKKGNIDRRKAVSILYIYEKDFTIRIPKL